jgi:RecA-family ATPase
MASYEQLVAEFGHPTHIEAGEEFLARCRFLWEPSDRQNGAAAEEPRSQGEDGHGFFSPPGRDDERPPRIVRPTIFVGKEPPRRAWIVQDWIPCGVATALYGKGGLGKSLLAQQLQTGTALGSTWLGLHVEQVVSLGVYCEDSEEELWRRQCDINADYGIGHDALASVHWMPRCGDDNILMTFARNGVGQPTKFHKEVLNAAMDVHARLVIVDTASDTFAGNENDRGQVRQFVQRALGEIAIKTDGAVLCCAHPSRLGISSGEGDSGSTAWSAAFRSRLYLREAETEPGERPDTDLRILERMKANYASRGDVLRLRWRNGAIEREPPLSPGMTTFGRVAAEDVFLGLVREFEGRNRRVSESSRASNYAPRVFGRLARKQRHDFKQGDFARAMESLFKSGNIENITYGRKSDERRKIVIAGGGAT